MRPKKKINRQESKSALKSTFGQRRKAESHNRQTDITKSVTGVDLGKKKVPSYNKEAMRKRDLKKAAKAEKLYKKAGASYEKAANAEKGRKHRRLVKKGAKQAVRSYRKAGIKR